MANMGYENQTNKWARKHLKSTEHKGYNVNAIVRQEKKVKKAVLTQDTTIRMELQALIRKLLAKDCTKEDILGVLQSEPKFAKFSTFFESYIDHYLGKGNRAR